MLLICFYRKVGIALYNITRRARQSDVSPAYLKGKFQVLSAPSLHPRIVRSQELKVTAADGE